MPEKLIYDDEITVTLRNGETGEERTEQRAGEFVNGLFIHEDKRGDRWRITTGTGLLIDTVMQAGMFVPRGWPINRDQARALAARMSLGVPEEVKDGRWSGEQWVEKDYGSFLSFKMLAGRVQSTLDLGDGEVTPMTVEEALAYLAEPAGV